MEDINFFWKKKTVLSYVLAILVFIIHISVLSNYTSVANGDSFMLPWRWFVVSVCRCAVPTFFVLSAAVYFRNYDNSKYIFKQKKRFTTLIIPYLSWNSIWMVFGYISTIYLSEYFIGRLPSDISIKGALLSILHWRDNLPFWFIFNLIVYTFFSPFLFLLLRKKNVGIVAIAITIYITSIGYGLPRSVFYMSESIIYYLVGAYIGIHHFEWFVTKSNYKTYVSIVIVALCIVFRMCFPIDTENWFIWNRPGFYGVVGLSVFSVAVCFAFDVFSYPQKLPHFFNHSFWVYAMHLNLSSIICKLFYLAFPKTIIFAWVNFFITIILTLSLIELTAVMLRRNWPFVYKVLCGAR